jgi:hypothetical protein
VKVRILDNQVNVIDTDPCGVQAVFDRVIVVTAVVLDTGQTLLLNRHHHLPVLQKAAGSVVGDLGTENIGWHSTTAVRFVFSHGSRGKGGLNELDHQVPDGQMPLLNVLDIAARDDYGQVDIGNGATATASQ